MSCKRHLVTKQNHFFTLVTDQTKARDENIAIEAQDSHESTPVRTEILLNGHRFLLCLYLLSKKHNPHVKLGGKAQLDSVANVSRYCNLCGSEIDIKADEGNHLFYSSTMCDIVIRSGTFIFHPQQLKAKTYTTIMWELHNVLVFDVHVAF